MGNETAVSDTGPLFHLCEIGQEGLLCLFDHVTIPEEVRAELMRLGVFNRVSATLNERLTVEKATQPELDEQRKAMSDFKVHRADLSVAA